MSIPDPLHVASRNALAEALHSLLVEKGAVPGPYALRLADQLIASGVVQVARPETDLSDAVTRAVAKALHDTADKWQWSVWADVPRRSDKVEERLATAQFTTDWLRARANEVGPRVTAVPVNPPGDTTTDADAAWCPMCARRIGLNRDGTFRRHVGGDQFDQQTDRICSMSHTLPQEG